MNQHGYSVVEVLGTGSFGTVFKCTDKNGSICCIKRLKPDQSLPAEWCDQVEQEIYLLKNLNHPRIIKFLHKFNTTNHVNIVMEHADGGSLSQFLAEKRMQKSQLDQYDVIRLFIDVLLGIEFLHMKNVVHKDIKSDNILISGDGRLKLADFGISKIMNVENCDFKNLVMTTSGKSQEATGTPSYMAPETLVNNYFTFASDMWSLGCIVYELCKLKPPFWFVTSMDQLIYHTKNAIYEPINFNGSTKYDPKLVSLCSSMITPEPDKRATIRDVITNDLIVCRYYRSYFDYGYHFKCTENVQNINNNDINTQNN